MPQATQTTRHIAIFTPLGEDVLLLRGFSAYEAVSHLFEFDLDLLSEDYEINFDDIIGHNVTIRMDLPEGGTRYWNGYINRFVQGVSTSTRFAQYQARMVPWPWFLTRTSDCRIFQEKSVPEIITQIFNDLGFTDIEDRLSGDYRTWIYCVQYRETDFNFVSRLMEQEGIYYYFLHEDGKCTLVLCDSLSKHDPYGDYAEIDFTPDTHSSAIQERISHWTLDKKVLSGKFAHTDYNFTKPATSLMSTEEDTKAHAQADFEIYDYPGEYPEKAHGDKYARIRMEELAQGHEVCTGQSDSRGICSGYLFTMARHTRNDQNREYLILSTKYQALAEDYETSGGQGEQCACTFTAIPSSVQFRPERTTPKPAISGTQTAVVTGPAGEEIHTDEHGRVKVQFHWDREGKYDENSSCWIRTSQVHAGRGFGGIDIPRIGEEVVVSFMEGDPDQPLITGRVYNAQLMPPFELPAQKVVSGMKSDSTPGSGGYNEMTMNDTKDKEVITVHAQKDMATTVENDQTLTVHNNRTSTVDVDDTGSVGNNQTLKVGVDQTETIGSNQTIEIGADQTVKIGSNQNLKVGADQKVKIGANQNLTIGSKRSTKVGADDTLKIGGKYAIGAAGKVSIKGDGNVEIKGPKILISADSEIVISVGGSTIKVSPGGIEYSGPKISSAAQGANEVKGGVVSVDGGTVGIKGGTVNVNC